MINYIKGDLLSVKEGVIVHGCNSMGVMGAGVAKQIKKKYPDCFEFYYNVCRNEKAKLGTCHVWIGSRGPTIVNAITQDTVGRSERNVSYDAIDDMMRNLSNMGFSVVNMPMIGAGLGGGNWEIIEKILNSYTDMTINVYVL